MKKRNLAGGGRVELNLYIAFLLNSLYAYMTNKITVGRLTCSDPGSNPGSDLLSPTKHIIIHESHLQVNGAQAVCGLSLKSTMGLHFSTFRSKTAKRFFFRMLSLRAFFSFFSLKS